MTWSPLSPARILPSTAVPEERIARGSKGRKGVMMLILNVVFMSLIGTAILGFLAWSVLAQHRRPGSAVPRFGPGLPPIIKLISIGASQLGCPATVARQI